MAIGIVNINAKQQQFAKKIEEAAPVDAGMYKAIFKRFVTLGFHDNKFEPGKIKFQSALGFELIEDMAGNKVPKHWKKFDDGTRTEEPKAVFRDYPITDDLHHKSGGYSIAKALDPNVPTIRRGREQEHEYIVDFDWEGNLDKTVLVMVAKKKSAAGNDYNQIQSVLPLGIPMEGEMKKVYFNLYSKEHKEIYENDVYFFEKKKIKESIVIPGEPECIYRGVEQPADNPQAPDAPAPEVVDIPKVDFDDTIPF